MKYKINQELYGVYADDETGKLDASIHKIRTIRGGKVYAILFIKDVTWVRLSKKIGHYGWDKNIPHWCRDSVKEGDQFYGLFTTRRQALLDLKKYVTKNKADYEPDIKKKILTTIKGQLTRLKK